jgi:hypothetical protein
MSFPFDVDDRRSTEPLWVGDNSVGQRIDAMGRPQQLLGSENAGNPQWRLLARLWKRV